MKKHWEIKYYKGNGFLFCPKCKAGAWTEEEMERLCRCQIKETAKERTKRLKGKPMIEIIKESHLEIKKDIKIIKK